MNSGLVYRWYREPGPIDSVAAGSAWALQRYYGALAAAGRCGQAELFLPRVAVGYPCLLIVRGVDDLLSTLTATPEVARLHRQAERMLEGFGWAVHDLHLATSTA